MGKGQCGYPVFLDVVVISQNQNTLVHGQQMYGRLWVCFDGDYYFFAWARFLHIKVNINLEQKWIFFIQLAGKNFSMKHFLSLNCIILTLNVSFAIAMQYQIQSFIHIKENSSLFFFYICHILGFLIIRSVEFLLVGPLRYFTYLFTLFLNVPSMLNVKASVTISPSSRTQWTIRRALGAISVVMGTEKVFLLEDIIGISPEATTWPFEMICDIVKKT